MNIASPLNVCTRCKAKTIPIIGNPVINITAGNPFYYQIPQHEIPDAGRYTCGTLPAGLSFSQDTGAITGTIGSQDIATYTVALSASNVRGVGYGLLTINVLNIRMKFDFRNVLGGGAATDNIIESLQVAFDGGAYMDANIGSGSTPGTIYNANTQAKWKIIYKYTGTYLSAAWGSDYDIDITTPGGLVTLLSGSQAIAFGSILSFNTVSGNTAASNLTASLPNSHGILSQPVGGIAYGIDGGYNNATKDTPGAITQSTPYSSVVDLTGVSLPLTASLAVLELASGESEASFTLGYDAVGSPKQQCITEVILNF